MPNFGEQAISSRKGDFEKAETSLEEIKKTQVGDLSLEELQALVTKRQELAGEKETIVEADHEEALGMEESRNAAAAEAARAELAKQEAARLVEEQAASEAADVKEAEAILARINGGEAPQAEVVEAVENNDVESIYGMNLEELGAVIRGEKRPEVVKPGDPDFKNKMEKVWQSQKGEQQAVFKLFERVLANQATEEEMQIAIAHATEEAKTYGLAGFHSAVPKAWYTNERIAEAMASTSPENKRFIEYVKKNYSDDDLRRQFKKIGEDGWVHTYERQK